MTPPSFEHERAPQSPPSGPTRRRRRHRFEVSLVTGAGALAALAVGSALGDIHSHKLHEKLYALFGAVAFLILAVIAIQSMSGTLEKLVSARAGRSGGSAVKVISSLTGYVIVIFVGLGLLAVPIQHLLLGGALTGVILGIAAQQALGNVFAGLVLLLARPFVIGERIKVRAGALGGVIEGVVLSMTLAYVTIHTDEGPVNVPNLALLAAAVGPAPPPASLSQPAVAPTSDDSAPVGAMLGDSSTDLPPTARRTAARRFGARARAARRASSRHYN